MQTERTPLVRDAVGRIPARDRDADREPHSSYHHPSRWATPARRRTDVYVVDLSRAVASPPVADEDPLALTA